MKQTFVREIPKARLTEAELKRLTELGFILKDKGESIEVWAEESVS